MQLIYTDMIYAYTVCILHYFFCATICPDIQTGFLQTGDPPNHQSKFDWVTFFKWNLMFLLLGGNWKDRQGKRRKWGGFLSSFSATYPMLTWRPMGDIWWSKISAPWLAIDGWFPSGDIANNGWIEGLWQLCVMLDEVDQPTYKWDPPLYR